MKLPEKEVVKPRLYKRNKLRYGVGINDADYATREHEKINGKYVVVWRCTIHQTWENMLMRCFSESYQQRHPTYSGCKPCDEWLIFSNFRRWMETQDWKGKQLDKDLLIEGNKVYSPDTCIFVDQIVNKFVTDSAADRGDYMIGVSLDKRRDKFLSRCWNPFTGKPEHLGYFTNELEAHLAWKTRKHEIANQLADSYYVTDERLAKALLTRYDENSDWTNK